MGGEGPAAAGAAARRWEEVRVLCVEESPGRGWEGRYHDKQFAFGFCKQPALFEILPIKVFSFCIFNAYLNFGVNLSYFQ